MEDDDTISEDVRPLLLMTLPVESRAGSPTSVSLGEPGCFGDTFLETSTDDVVTVFYSWRKNQPEKMIKAQVTPDKERSLVTVTLKRDLSYLYKLTAEELLERLKKRCRPDDLPPVPVLIQRKRPICHFLNFMGKSKSSAINSTSELGQTLSMPREPAFASSFEQSSSVATSSPMAHPPPPIHLAKEDFNDYPFFDSSDRASADAGTALSDDESSTILDLDEEDEYILSMVMGQT